MPEADNPLHGKRVLIVEDESRVAMMLGDILVDIGCEVAGMATRLGDALAKAEALEFDVALLDVNLDGEPSYPVAEAIAARGRAFVFATGYDCGHVPESLRDRPVLQKPYRLRDLERALQTALAWGAAARLA
ncbi:MAG TPA: response regulator [Rhodanobacteraceae bacterium]|nr:response regulator [Rhodanobacteraceae bacterium]